MTAFSKKSFELTAIVTGWGKILWLGPRAEDIGLCFRDIRRSQTRRRPPRPARRNIDCCQDQSADRAACEIWPSLWQKDAHKMSVRGVVFTDRRHGIGCSKWILARYDNVAIGRDRQVERTECRVAHEPRGLHVAIWSECDNSIVALARRTDPRAQKQSPIATESKSARKRYNSWREKMLAGRVKGTPKMPRLCALRKPT
jgi:hypothetical protein